MLLDPSIKYLFCYKLSSRRASCVSRTMSDQGLRLWVLVSAAHHDITLRQLVETLLHVAFEY